MELFFHLHIEKNAWNALHLLMQRKRVPMPSTFNLSEMCTMSEKNKINSKRKINLACDNFFELMQGMLELLYTELLHEWLSDA